jgi:HK97 family phage portal protein
MRCAAVLSCVRVLSETVAGLPFITYRRTSTGRERDPSLPVFKLLSSRPNRYQTAFEFREMMMAHCLLRGNGYAQKVFDGRGVLVELVPLNPTRVEPVLLPTGEVRFKVKTLDFQTIELGGEQIFHIKGLATDGIVGVSPITYARESVGLALATEEYGARLFKNDAKPGGILEHPGKLSDEAHLRLKNSWQSAHAGVQNAHKVAILEEGMKWTRIGVSSQDSQFIESRKFQIEEIARIFRVPPHLIGHLDHATFSNIEHQALDFVQHTILPWLRRWEQAISARLLSDEENQTHYTEFLVEGLLRGDIQSRYSAYAVGRQWGWLSADDVRRMENMEPLPSGAGEKYLVPLNMLDAAADPAQEPTAVRHTEPQFLFPVVRQQVEKYSDRVAKSKKPFRSHEKVIIEGLVPVATAFLQASGKRHDADSTAAAVVRFVDYWDANPDDAVNTRTTSFVEILRTVEDSEDEQQ